MYPKGKKKPKKHINPNDKFYKNHELISHTLFDVVPMSPPTGLAYAMRGTLRDDGYNLREIYGHEIDPNKITKAQEPE